MTGHRGHRCNKPHAGHELSFEAGCGQCALDELLQIHGVGDFNDLGSDRRALELEAQVRQWIASATAEGDMTTEQINLADGAGLIVRLYDAALAVTDDCNRFGAKGSFHYARAPREALMARLADAVQQFESHGVAPKAGSK